MASIEEQILAQIKNNEEGTIFLTEDFAQIANANALRVALYRLVKRGVLYRLASGIYVKPKTSQLLNQIVLPSLNDIAQAIAKRDKARIIPTGSFAMHALGLSEQIPLNVVYYTDGKARKIKIDNRNITFKKVSPKKLALKGKISKLAVLALTEIGKNSVAKSEEDKIVKLLKEENIEDLRHDLQLAPQWIAEIMAKAL
ncbi:DUF6088 family protein [Flagellimonas halotolerans]|mgnify:FL=1|uniref:DUF6088 family protein n=1 Tax=Flagellimonas halotolerans TaxID=3112164 RepID=A0ABU6IL47_9FLAO|nr:MULTISPECIES: DUF6088 family protein [unclassified Allomuricauda]MEC3963906.1 DUF6088 family protein [Muricauda sp. SYSU M86414]MEC4263776.1 DUF6088 family protein [Muricauda sp. SYSU M84420]